VAFATPNRFTTQAVEHPVTYAVASAAITAAFACVALASVGVAVALVGALMAGVFVLLLNLWLWSANGPGRRWAARRGVSSGSAQVPIRR